MSSFKEKLARAIGVTELLGNWDASSNSPELLSGIGKANTYYIVSTAGQIDLDGSTDWEVGDWAFFTGTKWEKVDNTEKIEVVDSMIGNETNQAPSVSSVKQYIDGNYYELDERLDVLEEDPVTKAYVDAKGSSVATKQVSGSNSGGNSSEFARADHSHVGVSSIAATGQGFSGAALIVGTGNISTTSNPGYYTTQEDAYGYLYIDGSALLPKSGGAMTGELNMSGYPITAASSGSIIATTPTLTLQNSVNSNNKTTVQSSSAGALTITSTTSQTLSASSGNITISSDTSNSSVNSSIAFRIDNQEVGRFDSSGEFQTGTSLGSATISSADSSAAAGVSISSGGVDAAAYSEGVCNFNRMGTDGPVVFLKGQGITEGTISVSGTTVSYNSFAGSHWSQLEDGSKPEILRGTVMETIDTMCEWPGEEPTERLAKCKISDTVASKRVYGVFMCWDEDWKATNDLYVTALGAFVCRIAAGVVVSAGDLLESNGDGCARTQSDDAIRSSTIAKVTSSTIIATYEDGSYIVPVTLYCG